MNYEMLLMMMIQAVGCSVSFSYCLLAFISSWCIHPLEQPSNWYSVISLPHRFLPQTKEIPVHQSFPDFCFNCSYINYASVDVVMTPVILATLKILIWLIDWYHGLEFYFCFNQNDRCWLSSIITVNSCAWSITWTRFTVLARRSEFGVCIKCLSKQAAAYDINTIAEISVSIISVVVNVVIYRVAQKK